MKELSSKISSPRPVQATLEARIIKSEGDLPTGDEINSLAPQIVSTMQTMMKHIESLESKNALLTGNNTDLTKAIVDLRGDVAKLKKKLREDKAKIKALKDQLYFESSSSGDESSS